MQINEAIRASNFQAAQNLIIKYLKKHLGTKIYAYPVPEVFTPAGGMKQVGIRYYITMGGVKSIRLNWKTISKIGAQGLVSIDYWDGSKNPQPIPTHHYKLDSEQSLVKILPMVVDIMNGKLEQSGFFVNESVGVSNLPMITDFTQVQDLNEASYTSGDVAKTVANVIAALRQGIAFSDQYKAGGTKKYGPRWNKIVEVIQALYPNILKKEGNKKVVDTAVAGTIEPKKILTTVTGDPDAVAYEVQPGSREVIETEGTSDTDIERLTYEEQIDSLKTAMKLLMSNATNSIYIAGRGGCLDPSTLVNIDMDGAKQLNFSSIQVLATMLHSHMETGVFYDISDLNMQIETRDGMKPIKSFVTKDGIKTNLTFSDGSTIGCSTSHLFITPEGKKFCRDLKVGDCVNSRTGTVVITDIIDTEEHNIFYDIEVDSAEHTFFTANGIEHHNTGKTQNVEDELAAVGKTDGNGYIKITGSASTAGIYRLMFQNRKNIMLFDDSDGALGDQDSRNLFKAASDTKKIRKISWQKGGGSYVDPEDYDYDAEEEQDKLPRSFEFTGKIIFISNLSLSKLDPDGALRTRGFVLNIDPTDEELVTFMYKICTKIPLEVNYKLSPEDRKHVVDLIAKKKLAPKSINLRMLVRGLNIMAGTMLGNGSMSEAEKFITRFA